MILSKNYNFCKEILLANVESKRKISVIRKARNGRDPGRRSKGLRTVKLQRAQGECLGTGSR